MDRLIFYHLLLFGCCGYAILRGEGIARIVAITFLLGNYATLALRSQGGLYSSVEVGGLCIDVLAFAAFAFAALISTRFWPMWVAGLQLTTTFGHVLKAAEPHLLPLVYAVALRAWSYPVLIILAAGVWRSRMRLGASLRASPG